jgi:hypothetical protein
MRIVIEIIEQSITIVIPCKMDELSRLIERDSSTR